METLSPFIDSGIDNVLMQTNPNFTVSCFLLEFLNISEGHLLGTLLHDSQAL